VIVRYKYAMDPSNVQIDPHDHDYFIPSTMFVDIDEHLEFLGSSMLFGSIMKAMDSPNSLLYITNVIDSFPRTTAMIRNMLAPAGLDTVNASLFVASAGAKVSRIHCDAIGSANDLKMLEARFSFYGMSPAPGIISWWNDAKNVVLESGPVIVDGKHVGTRAGFIHEWSRKKLPWSEIPLPSHSIRTDIASGFVRTNVPHTVLQEEDHRITVSYMIVDMESKSPVGCWDRVRSYFG